MHKQHLNGSFVGFNSAFEYQWFKTHLLIFGSIYRNTIEAKIPKGVLASSISKGDYMSTTITNIHNVFLLGGEVE